MQTPVVIFLMGPTASGKTSIALELASRMDAEIISVDSALVYKGMDIGSAKPSSNQQAQIPHHLLDICDPITPYSVADFCHDAQRAIQDIIARGRIPLLVGGTMMYFNALKSGLATLPSSDPNIRAQIELRAQQYGWPALHQELMHLNAQAAKKLHPHDAQRISRALEVYALTGAQQSRAQNQALAYTICPIALMPAERAVLHKHIDQRFDEMLALGFMDEARALFDRGDLSIDLPSMRAVGYRQAWRYFQGEGDFAHMRASTIAATRQLAKRQVTWLRKWTDLSWFVPFSSLTIYDYLKKRLQR